MLSQLCDSSSLLISLQISEEDAALVPRSEVLLGHMLAASLAQFKYPEEWQFYLRTEVGTNKYLIAILAVPYDTELSYVCLNSSSV